MAWRLQHNPKMAGRYDGLAKKTAAGDINWTGQINLVPQVLKYPSSIKKPTTFFVNSMSDLFHKDIPFEYIAQVYDEMISCPRHIFQVLTKRPDRALEFYQWYPKVWDAKGWLDDTAHIWIGASVEDQAATSRIYPLTQILARIHFLSCEPLLGPIDLFNVAAPVDPEDPDEKYFYDALNVNGGYVWEFEPGRFEPVDGSTHSGIQWVIAGGESGHDARPMHPDWARSLRDQCESAEVPFFFKQNGEYVSVSEVAGKGDHYTFPDGATVRHIGKKAAGNTLDGKTYQQFPDWEAAKNEA